MKKKILLAVVAIICLLSMVLAGCSNIKIENVDEDVIKVLQDAIANSEQYSTYYIREKTNTNPKDIASNTMVEYMLNVQSDKDLPEKEKIAGVDKTKINFSVKTTKGITESIPIHLSLETLFQRALSLVMQKLKITNCMLLKLTNNHQQLQYSQEIAKKLLILLHM